MLASSKCSITGNMRDMGMLASSKHVFFTNMRGLGMLASSKCSVFGNPRSSGVHSQISQEKNAFPVHFQWIFSQFCPFPSSAKLCWDQDEPDPAAGSPFSHSHHDPLGKSHPTTELIKSVENTNLIKANLAFTRKTNPPFSMEQWIFPALPYRDSSLFSSLSFIIPGWELALPDFHKFASEIGGRKEEGREKKLEK